MRSSTLVLLFSFAAACTNEVTIRSDDDGTKDDPNRPDFDSANDLNAPIAVCGARPNPAAPGEPVDLIGEGSYDPDDSEIISYTWQLPIRPAGSRARLPNGTANVVGFEPDVLGSYVATLEVTDEAGTRSTTCSTELKVKPSQQLYIELSTTFDNDDLELVVARGNDVSFPPAGPDCKMPADGDVCSGNACNVDWGPAGAAGNPTVISDDVNGGTEAIGLGNPADGVYTIGVYDRSSGLLIADHEATVAVWVNGVRSWAGSKTLKLECQSAKFVQVAWPSGSTTPL